MSLLNITDLSLRVGGDDGYDLLREVSLTVDSGETVGLVGESGSGKSLTARAVLGLLPSRSSVAGSVSFRGVDMLTAGAEVAREVRRNCVSMVFQDPRSGINPVRTIGDYMTESLRLCHGWAADRATARAVELLHAVGLTHPERLLKQYPHEFSGGMLQRVMIAGALTTEPPLLLCDEPTTALDVTTQAEIVRILVDQQRQRDMGMLFITHDLNLASTICDRIYVIQRGVVVESGPTKSVFTRPTADYTRQLLSATPTLRVHERAVEQDTSNASQESILRVENVSKSYKTRFGRTVAVKNVSFSVERGTSFGVVGESGSGKSTISRMLVGLESPDSGTITLAGLDATTRPRGRSARLARARTRQIVFQDPYLSLDPRVPIGRAAADVMRLHFPDRADRRSHVEVLLRQVGLDARQAAALPRDLSGGQRQRAAIASALAADPELLVLDEATSALDVTIQAQVLELLREIRHERGLSLLFVSHDLAVVQELCDETLVLRHGEVVEQGDTRDLLSHPTTDYTRLLVDSAPRTRWEIEPAVPPPPVATDVQADLRSTE